MFLASFSALWWPNIWPKIRCLELFEKTIGSIHFIPGIYPYGMSLLTPIHFRVPSLIFCPLVAKYLVKNRFPELFGKTIGSIPKFFWNKVFMKNSHLCSTRLQNRNLYWTFLDEVGSDQSGGILSPFMGTACWILPLYSCCSYVSHGPTPLYKLQLE